MNKRRSEEPPLAAGMWSINRECLDYRDMTAIVPFSLFSWKPR